MKLRLLLVLAAAALAATSCKSGPAGEGAGGSAGGATSGGRTAGDVQVPAGAQWTLYCISFNGPDHIAQAKGLKERLLASAEKTGLREFWVVHSDTESSLRYGFYTTIDSKTDEKEASRIGADKGKLGRLMTAGGEKLFSMVIPVRLESDDPEAPAEWNLANAKGYWTLQVGVFKDVPDRKREATEAVRKAREAGVEAYYYHGEMMSMVCIGAWPENAVSRKDDEARTAKKNEVIILFNEPMKETPHGLKAPDGTPIRVIAPKFEILDPSMKRAKETYPEHVIDGVAGIRVRDPRTGQEIEKRSTSFFVVMPNAATPEGTPALPQRNIDVVDPSPLIDLNGMERIRSQK